jgi:Caspase domain
MNRNTLTIAVFVAFHAMLVPMALLAAESGPVRVAVVVGANGAPPGRRALRYSHDDARAFAQVLAQTGGFRPNDINVLLDAGPQALLDAVDAALARMGSSDGTQPAGDNGLILFYYSGHADQQMLYPGGKPLPLSELRRRLDDGRPKVRIGIIDACRGGGWTGAKGLSEAAPFEVGFPAILPNQGSILIASSSGAEEAHESETLQGSFFTHHWNAGLLGAADRDADGQVTVSEAFDYARALTVRDTALVSREPQHPSFRIDLRGRQDIVMASLETQKTIVTLHQKRGQLQLVHLDSGLVVLETVAVARKVRVAIKPGNYLVRRRVGDDIWATQVRVEANVPTDVHEASLVLMTGSRLGAKSAEPRAISRGIVPQGMGDVQLALGVRHAPVIDPGLRFTTTGDGAAGLLRATVGLGRGWHLALPLALAYGKETARIWNWIAWGGLPVLGYNESPVLGHVVSGRLGGGADLRRHVGTSGTLDFSINTLGSLRWTSQQSVVAGAPTTWQDPKSWTVQLTTAYSYSLLDVLTVSFGGGVVQNVLVDGDWATGSLDGSGRGMVVALGSVQRRGLRPLPLVRVYLGDQWSLDGHVVVAYNLSTRAIAETYLGGATWMW